MPIGIMLLHLGQLSQNSYMYIRVYCVLEGSNCVQQDLRILWNIKHRCFRSFIKGLAAGKLTCWEGNFVRLV